MGAEITSPQPQIFRLFKHRLTRPRGRLLQLSGDRVVDSQHGRRRRKGPGGPDQTVQAIEPVEAVETIETIQPVQAVQAVETVQTIETVELRHSFPSRAYSGIPA